MGVSGRFGQSQNFTVQRYGKKMQTAISVDMKKFPFFKIMQIDDVFLYYKQDLFLRLYEKIEMLFPCVCAARRDGTCTVSQ